MKAVEFNEVSYTYAGQPALRPLSINFEDGKITAIIGKSGSGKTTILRLINGLLKPTSGNISVFGKSLDYANILSIRLKMGYMVQGNGLFPHLNIEKNISIAGKILPDITPPLRVGDLMDLVGLPASYKIKYPQQLSGGEQQRVALCRALFLDPPILLMDEPLGALDPVTRHGIHRELNRLQQLIPRTILLVTHDMREAQRLAQMVLVLDQGVVQQYGATADVLEHPANASVVALIESSAW